jgi:Holliday junction resolvasome RuvABC endonuclease subunit
VTALWAWGVDVGYAARKGERSSWFAFKRPGDLGVSNPTWVGFRVPDVHAGHPKQLGVIRDHLVGFARTMAGYFPPVAVYVEQPVGRTPNPALMMAAGEIATTLRVALSGVHTHPVEVFLVTPPTWKRPVVGNGNAGKDACMARAVELGYRGDVQDEADAVCIAEACLQDHMPVLEEVTS